MRLTQITIENFGIYEGLNTFEFPYSNDKKVSIIIGKNGAGKTTFLNAVKSCFFGPMILKNRTITKPYEEFIRNKLNINSLKNSSSHFSIETTFISHLHKFDGEFIIKRSWTLYNNIFTETVIVKKNQYILSSKEQDKFFNVMYHAFPLDMFDLFYLDGEKIDQLNVLNTNLIDMIESSINIDLFKSLKNDLITYAIKRVKNKQLDSLELNKTSSQKILSGYHTELEHLYSEKENSENLVSNAKSNLIRFKEALNISLINIDDVAYDALTNQIIEEKRFIHELLVSYLPYVSLKDQLKKIETIIDLEESSKTSQIIQNAISIDLETHLLKTIGASYSSTVKSVLNEIKRYYSSSDLKIIHRLNTEDYYNLKSKFSDLFNHDPSLLMNKIAELNKHEQEANILSRKIEEYHAAEKSGQLDELLELQNKLSKNQLTLANINTRIDELNEKVAKRKIILNETEKEIWQELKNSNINIILEQLNSVLEKYIERIKADKIKVIEAQTKVMFDRLIRKQGFIKDFTIKDQMVYLLDENNNQLDHSHLSAGEKQLFILSLIYAIIQSSERTVPMVFDTLLSRLDEGHRDNVFKEFIASCPDQVIILATDSELANIDENFLKGITNTVYNIDFSKKDNQMIEMR